MAKDVEGKISFDDYFKKESHGFFVKLNNNFDEAVVQEEGANGVYINLQGTRKTGQEYSTVELYAIDDVPVNFGEEPKAREKAQQINEKAEDIRAGRK